MISTYGQGFDCVADPLGFAKNHLANELYFSCVEFDGRGFLPTFASLQRRCVAGQDLAILNVPSFITGQPTAVGRPGQHISYDFGHT